MVRGIQVIGTCTCVSLGHGCGFKGIEGIIYVETSMNYERVRGKERGEEGRVGGGERE